MTINIRCVHLALMISLCFSSIINAMYLVAIDTMNHTILIVNYDQVTFDTINDVPDAVIVKCGRISSIGLSFSFICLQLVYRVNISLSNTFGSFCIDDCKTYLTLKLSCLQYVNGEHLLGKMNLICYVSGPEIGDPNKIG